MFKKITIGLSAVAFMMLSSMIYAENSQQSFDKVCSEDESEEEFIDMAYQNMLDNERYIVELISSRSGNKTTMENWEYNLQYLVNNYAEISELDEIDISQVESYIGDYQCVKLDTSNVNSTSISASTFSTGTYDYEAAVEYANTYALSYNNKYGDWTDYGGDCANFVSQCLYAGGKQIIGLPSGQDAVNDYTNWFCYSTTTDTSMVSATWRGANAFMTFWKNRATNYKQFSGVCSSSYIYGFKGDAISLLNSNGRAYHTLMIVGYENNNSDFIVAAHTYDTNTSRLSSYSAPGGFIIYRMR